MKAQNVCKVLVVASVSLILSQVAFAQGVGNIGSLPTSFQGPPWVVGTPTGPIPVSLNPAGPAWSKNFTGPNGGPFVQPALGAPLPVRETLLVIGNLPWTDWHEDVMGIDASGAPDPGWSWANPVLLVNGLPAPGLTTSLSGGNLSFFFNPVAPGSIVTIQKDLVYNGIPGTAFIGTLAIHEYPTPEPATMGLLGIGSLLVWRRRNRTNVA